MAGRCPETERNITSLEVGCDGIRIYCNVDLKHFMDRNYYKN
jgi:hypothetical protein